MAAPDSLPPVASLPTTPPPVLPPTAQAPATSPSTDLPPIAPTPVASLPIALSSSAPPLSAQTPTPILTQTGGIAPGLHRIHPAYVIMAAVQTVFVILVGAFAAAASSAPYLIESLRDGSLPFKDIAIIGLIAGLLILLILVTVLVAILYYKRFLWEITQSDIHIYSGIIFKKKVHIPFQRVQSIDFQASVLERLLGIVKLKIETAGGAANTGVRIPALKLGEAEALRAEVFRRKKTAAQTQEQKLRAQVAVRQAAEEEGSPADRFVTELGQVSGDFRGIFAESYDEDAPIEYEHGLRARELLLAAVSGDHNFVGLAFIVGLLSQAPLFIDLFGLGDTTVRFIANAATQRALPFVIAGVLIIAAFLFLLTLGATAITYGGFTCRRRGGRIEVERGLLTKHYKGVAIPRVQSVEIRQGFIRRLIGYAELRLMTVDSVDASQQQNGQQVQTAGLVIHPFVKMNKVEGILLQLIPEYADCPTAAETRRLPPVARRRAFMRLTLIPMALLAAFLLAVDLLALVPFAPAHITQAVLLGSWGLFGLICIICFVTSLLWYRHAAYGYNRTMLYIRQGAWGMVTSIIPRKKIQWAGTDRNPFQRLAGVASITATTAAGSPGTTTTLRDLPLDDADAYIDWLRPRRRQERQED